MRREPPMIEFIAIWLGVLLVGVFFWLGVFHAVKVVLTYFGKTP